ncbi:MAG4270 family putative restriction endonuclease [Candidatus Mycoplasma pogonae]
MSINKQAIIPLDEELFWTEWTFVSSNFNKKISKNSTKSIFKGKITFAFDKLGVIYNRQIIFEELVIDLNTTASWFENKNSNFRKREKIFQLLNIEKQIIRNSKSESFNFLKLNKQQLDKFNNWINTYHLTQKNNLNIENTGNIKTILPIIRGNNPSGEVGNFKNAQILAINNNETINFVLFFDLMTIKKRQFNQELLTEIYNDENLYINDYLNFIDSKNKNLFQKFQKNLSNDEFNNISHKLKTHAKLIYKIKEKIEKDVQSERSKYSKMIQISKNFVFQWKYAEDLEKAHIYPVYKIKQKMEKILFKYQDIKDISEIDFIKYNDYKNLISDEENYINLYAILHKHFDKQHFTYDSKNGKMKIINSIKMEAWLKDHKNIAQAFSQIPSNKLTTKRIAYLKLREAEILEKNK